MTVERETIDTLVQAFQEHKTDLNSRLNQLEKSNRPVLPQANEKSIKNEDASTMTKRFVNRPSLSMAAYKTNMSHSEEDKNFINYIRSGDSHLLDVKSLSGTNDHEGGYLVPHAINYQLSKNLDKLSALRYLASVTQISTSALDLLIDKEGAQVGWVGENNERDDTEMSKLTKLVIPVHEMYAKPRATQRLLDDSAVNLEQWIAETVSHKMAVIENQAFIQGDGDKKPTGILKYDTSEKYEWGKIQHLISAKDNTIIIEDLIVLQSMLKTEYLMNAAWIMSRQAASIIRRMKNQEENLIWQASLLEGQPDRLLGYPVHISDEMPDISDPEVKITILFGDFKRGYQIVDRQGVYTLRDPYSSKPYVEFYTTKRVGGDVIDFQAIKILKIKNS